MATDAPVVIAGNRLSRFYLRFHISLILLFSFSAGVLASKALLLLGVNEMLWRYPVALLVTYTAFFAGVRVWLAYVGAHPFGRSSRLAGDGGGGGFDIGSWGGASRSIPSIRGGGGDFAGAGASGSFAAESPAVQMSSGYGIASGPARTGSWFSFGSGSHASASSGGGGSGGGGGGGIASGLDLDLDGDGWLVVLLLVLIAALLTSVFGAVIYLLHAAPAMLADVAFQAMLTGGLVKSSRNWRNTGWQISLFKSTWIPFTLILVLALLTAGLAAHLFPGARTLSEALMAAWSRVG